MTTHKRFLNIYTIAAALALLLALCCYLTARKWMCSYIVVGMSRAELIQRLGTPTFTFGQRVEVSRILEWKKSVINDEVFYQQIAVFFNENDQVDGAEITNMFFDHKFHLSIEAK